MAVRRIYFIRHAKALDRALWNHPDHLRPLTEPGYRQAKGLVRALRRAGIERVVSSRAIRCVDTVWWLAEAAGLPVEKHDALFEGARATDTIGLMRRIRARRIALCTHGDVMEDVLEHLADAGVDLDGGLRLAKGAYWIFDLDDDSGVTRAAYHHAPRAD